MSGIKRSEKPSSTLCLKHKAMFAASPVTLAVGLESVFLFVFPLEEHGKVGWIKQDVHCALQGPQTLHGEKRGHLKEGLVQEVL